MSVFLWIVLKVATNPIVQGLKCHYMCTFKALFFNPQNALWNTPAVYPWTILQFLSVPFSYFQSVQTHVGLEVPCPPLISCWMSAVGRRCSLIRFHVEKDSTRVSRETCAVLQAKLLVRQSDLYYIRRSVLLCVFGIRGQRTHIPLIFDVPCSLQPSN